jgi:hypothetical protein
MNTDIQGSASNVDELPTLTPEALASSPRFADRDWRSADGLDLFNTIRARLGLAAAQVLWLDACDIFHTAQAAADVAPLVLLVEHDTRSSAVYTCYDDHKGNPLTYPTARLKLLYERKSRPARYADGTRYLLIMPVVKR